MIRQLICALMLLTALAASAQTPCGEAISTSSNPAQRTPNNYTSITLPSQGVTTADTDFTTSNHCKYYRESTSVGSPATPTYHSYVYSPFNCDDTLEIVGSPDIGSFKIINVPSGTTYLAGPLFGGDNNNQPMFAHCQAGTESTDKYTVYYLNGAKIQKERIDTQTITTVHDFAPDGYTAVCFGCSSNGPHTVMQANADDTIAVMGTASGGGYDTFVYNLATATQVTPIKVHTTFQPAPESFPSHTFVIDNGSSLDFYNANGTLNTAGLLSCCHSSHHITGKDSAGADVIFYDDFNDGDASGQCQYNGSGLPGVRKFNMSTHVKTCLAVNGYGGKHLSVTQDGVWLAVAHSDDLTVADSCLESYYVANSSFNWQQYFTRPPGNSPMPNEIDLVKTDGSTTYRLIHHQTRIIDNSTCNSGIDGTGSFDYWAEARGAISYSGKSIAFDSNYGISPAVLSSLPNHGYAETFVLVPFQLGLDFSPASINFNPQPLNTTSSGQSTTITNSSSSTITLTSEVLQTGTQFAISANTCGASLAASATCVATMTFTPTSAGTKTDNLVVTSSGAGSPQSVPLSGIGLATPAISPTTGTYSGSQTITITDATAGVTIYYTTNGTTPTNASTQYSGSFTLSSTATVKAIAYLSGIASGIDTEVITISGTNNNLTTTVNHAVVTHAVIN